MLLLSSFMNNRKSREPSRSSSESSILVLLHSRGRSGGEAHGHGRGDGDPLLKRRPVLRIARVAVEETSDFGVLADERHLGRLSLAPEAAEAVLDDGVGVVALEAIAVGDDAVDLELELGAEVLGKGGLVDKVGVAADEQHARGRPGVLLLGRLDAIPHDAHTEAIDSEASLLAGFEESLGSDELEEDDLGGAAVVLSVRLRCVDVSRVDAAGGTHAMNGGDETMGCEGRGQVDQEKGAVELVGNIGRSIAWQVGISVILWTEPKSHLRWRIGLVSTD